MTDRARDGAPNARDRERSLSRRAVLTGTAVASVALAGCSGRLPGNDDSVDVATSVDENRILWNYPAAAVADDADADGIGYAAIRVEAFDGSGSNGSVEPLLTFRLNSTVGRIASGASDSGYQAERFRFRLGVPRSYDDVAGLRAFVQPDAWPEIRTRYEFRDGRRDLVVRAPNVNTDGTIVVDGRFRPEGRALPRQLHCAFEVHASRPGCSVGTLSRRVARRSIAPRSTCRTA